MSSDRTSFVARPRSKQDRDEELPTQIADNLQRLGLFSGRHTRYKQSKGKGKDRRKTVSFSGPPSVAPSERRTPSRISQHSDGRSSVASAGPRSSRGMAGILDIDRTNNRKDRTFIGSECAVCEEPLEFTLRGERILQLTCAHVAHEACFYEYIRDFESQYCPLCHHPLGLDSSRGGNVLDLEKLSKIAKPDPEGDRRYDRNSTSNPLPWDQEAGDRRVTETAPAQDERQSVRTQGRESAHGRHRSRNSRSGSAHVRNDSGNSIGAGSLHQYAVPHQEHNDQPAMPVSAPRQHDYDSADMESSMSSPLATLRSNIAAPIVTIRSEFPTLTRSRQQQSLTCVVTVEVPERKYQPGPANADDGRTRRGAASAMSGYGSLRSPVSRQRKPTMAETRQQLDEATEELHNKVDNWHGLDFSRFGQLRLHGHIRVGKDRKAWQDLDCYLFTEMLICVKERKQPNNAQGDGPSKTKSTLKGSILIKKHLKEVEMFSEDNVLTLSLSVAELPSFHLQFQERQRLELWRRALLDIDNPNPPAPIVMSTDDDDSETDEDDYPAERNGRSSAARSSYAGSKNYNTPSTDYSMHDHRLLQPVNTPVDMIVVIPVSSSMQRAKVPLIRDTLKFVVQNLGEKDRMGLVTFGSSGGGVPVVPLTSKKWKDWNRTIESIRPVGQKSLRADAVEGANVAMDLLMQRKNANPISCILLVSDSSTADPDGVDFVIQRAEAAKVVIHSFGLGLTHKPDTMIELSTRTKASYTYVKEWPMLRECVAGVIGSLQTTSHQNVKLKLRLPEGSPAKFYKISGALSITKRASGRDAEASLGDLRYGDKRDILVQLTIVADTSSTEQQPQDPWNTIVSGLEALGGNLDQEEPRAQSVEEVPLIQADLVYGDILRDGATTQLPRPSLLAITMLPLTRNSKTSGKPISPLIPPHPSVVQRRMELLTSDMLTLALTLVSRNQHDRAHHVLRETRSILRGLGKGSLPPLPPGQPNPPAGSRQSAPPASTLVVASVVSSKDGASSTSASVEKSPTLSAEPERKRTPSPPASAPLDGPERPPFSPASVVSNSTTSPGGIDSRTMSALDAELESSLEWINHPAVFLRDSRKAVLQAIGVISSQRGYTFRTQAEALWAERVDGIRRLGEKSKEWRAQGVDDDTLGIVEES